MSGPVVGWCDNRWMLFIDAEGAQLRGATDLHVRREELGEIAAALFAPDRPLGTAD